MNTNLTFAIVALNRTTNWIVCLFLWSACSILPAQQLEPLFDESNDAQVSSVEIEQIYNLTEVARSVSDFERIVEKCEKLLDKTIFEKDKKYLGNLVAWARNRAGHLHLKNAASMKQMGLEAESSAEFGRAVKQFDIVIETKPLTWRAWMGRGLVHSNLGEYEKALEDFVEVTKLQRGNNSAWFNCAEICSNLKKYEEAIEHYSRLISNDPTDVQSRTGRAHCYVELEEFPKALADYRTVVKLQSKNESAICNLADALVKVELWDDALEQLEIAAALPKSLLGKERLANFLMDCPDENLQDTKRAVELAEQAVTASKTPVDFLETLAAAYTANDQTELADATRERMSELTNSTRQAKRVDESQTK